MARPDCEKSFSSSENWDGRLHRLFRDVTVAQRYHEGRNCGLFLSFGSGALRWQAARITSRWVRRPKGSGHFVWSRHLILPQLVAVRFREGRVLLTVIGRMGPMVVRAFRWCEGSGVFSFGLLQFLPLWAFEHMDVGLADTQGNGLRQGLGGL